MPKNLVGAGISFDVMSSHATRLIVMLIGGAILTSDSTGVVCTVLHHVCDLWLFPNWNTRHQIRW